MSSLTIASRIRRRGSAPDSGSSAILAGGARYDCYGSGGNKSRCLSAFRLAEALQFARKRALGQPGVQGHPTAISTWFWPCALPMRRTLHDLKTCGAATWAAARAQSGRRRRALPARSARYRHRHRGDNIERFAPSRTRASKHDIIATRRELVSSATLASGTRSASIGERGLA